MNRSSRVTGYGVSPVGKSVMNSEFWQERWKNKEIGFHQEKINPYLQRYWAGLKLDTSSAVRPRILVPLCGKSLDMLWIKEQGCDVIGVELSPIACEEFFDENRLEYSMMSLDQGQIYQSDGITLFCGDLFELDSQAFGAVDAVFDRAALVALPETMRKRYAARIRQISGDKLRCLLVTMDYSQDEMDGPPFSVTEEEVRALYEETCQVRLLERFDVLEGNDRFLERGLTRLEELSFILLPKG